MRILIAEDDYTSRVMLSAVLHRGGHEVIETANGTQAWQVLQQPGAPRLLILDWMMPGMDGPEVMERVRSLATHCPPYIIMLTARGGNVDIVAGLRAGADDYLTKPIECDEILARVEVGQRIIKRALVQHRHREKAQLYRVEATRRINELQDALASKEAQLHQTQSNLRTLDAELQSRC